MKMKQTMKSIRSLTALTLTGVAMVSASANAAILASWDAWADSDTAGGLASDFSTASITTTITGDAVRDIVTNRGSTDETFGTLTGAVSDTNALRMNKPDGSILQVNVANNSGATLFFDQLHFDGVFTGDSIRDFEVVFVNTSTASTSGLLGTGSITSDTNTVGFVADYDDFNINVSSITLDSGDEGYFQITFDGGTGGINSASTIDNVALTTVVPEPSSAALLGLGGLALIMRRRQ